MDETARAAFIIAQSICASAKLCSMTNENMAAMLANQPMPHKPEDFLAVPGEFGIAHNDAYAYLRG